MKREVVRIRISLRSEAAINSSAVSNTMSDYSGATTVCNMRFLPLVFIKEKFQVNFEYKLRSKDFKILAKINFLNI